MPVLCLHIYQYGCLCLLHALHMLTIRFWSCTSSASTDLSLRWDGLRHTPVVIIASLHVPPFCLWPPAMMPHSPLFSTFHIGSYLNRGASRQDRPLADSDCLSHGAKLLICLLLFPWQRDAHLPSFSSFSLSPQIQILAPISTTIKESQVNSVYIGCLFVFQISCVCLVFGMCVISLYIKKSFSVPADTQIIGLAWFSLPATNHTYTWYTQRLLVWRIYTLKPYIHMHIPHTQIMGSLRFYLLHSLCSCWPRGPATQR